MSASDSVFSPVVAVLCQCGTLCSAQWWLCCASVGLYVQPSGGLLCRQVILCRPSGDWWVRSDPVLSPAVAWRVRE